MSVEQLAQKVDMLSGTVCNEHRRHLDANELVIAKTRLINRDLSFEPSVRTIDDPVLYGQEFGLFSFTPSRSAQPDANGIYGAFKIRGNFKSVEEAEERAEYLIRTHDSYNEIFTIRVGQTVPLTKKSELAEKVNFVDVSKQVSSIVSDNVKDKRAKEEEEMKTLHEREGRLLKENDEILKGEYKEDTLDAYIMKKTKKAQLMYMLVENLNKIKNEIIPAIRKARDEIGELETVYPDYPGSYYERFKQAREQVGIKDSDIEAHKSFMRFLVDDNDVDVDALETFIG
jgi:hypothetical protein